MIALISQLANPRLWIALAIAAALSWSHWQAYSLGGSEARADLAQYQADTWQAIAQLNTDAATTLANERAKTRKVEQALQAQTDKQNTQDAHHAKTIADLSARWRAAAGPAGRLRDPYATSQAAGCGAGSGSPTSATASAAGDRAADAADAGGLLSAELSGLLQRLQREADAINLAYASCRERAIADRDGMSRSP